MYILLKWSFTTHTSLITYFKIEFFTDRMTDHVDPPNTPYRLPILEISTWSCFLSVIKTNLEYTVKHTRLGNNAHIKHVKVFIAIFRIMSRTNFMDIKVVEITFDIKMTIILRVGVNTVLWIFEQLLIFLIFRCIFKVNVMLDNCNNTRSSHFSLQTTNSANINMIRYSLWEKIFKIKFEMC